MKRTPERRKQPRPATAENVRTRRRGPLAAVENHLLRHLQTLFYTLGQLARRPVSSLLTCAVIGIALALPAGLHLLLGNAQSVARGWDGTTQISLFLHQQVAESDGQALAAKLEREAAVAVASYISREAALAEFRELSGFGEALTALEENPLPAVVVVRPDARTVGGPESLESLRERLAALPEVEAAQLDMQWVKRLYALMDIGRRGIWFLGGVLGLAVLLVVGNTIRLAIQNRRDEIVITKLIGGTDAFIRRPFLYTGFWYGLIGGFIALALVAAGFWLLQAPVRQLAALYGGGFTLEGLDAVATLLLLGGGTALGLGGSWVAVGRHLREIEPR